MMRKTSLVHSPVFRRGSIYRARRNGFTLVEVMVTVVIVAAVVGTMAGSFYGSMRAWQAAQNRIDLTQGGRAALALLSRELAGVFAGKAGPGFEFSGDPERMLFTTTVEPSSWQGTPDYDLKRIAYFMDESMWQKGMSLWRWEASFPYSETWSQIRLDDVGITPESDELAEGVHEVEFAYFDGQDWLESWGVGLEEGKVGAPVTQAGLPLAVWVRITLGDPSGKWGKEETLSTVIRLELAQAAPQVAAGPESLTGQFPGSMPPGVPGQPPGMFPPMMPEMPEPPEGTEMP